MAIGTGQTYSNQSIATRMGLYFFAVFLTVGMYQPFWPVWLASRGLGPVEIGFLIGVGQLTRAVSSPVIAHFIDRRGDRRRPLLALSIMTMLFFGVYQFCDALWQYAVIAVLVGSTWGLIMPLGDSMALVNAREGRFQYGRVRLCGSISFILATLLGGQVLELWSEDAIFWVLMVLFVLVVGSCLVLPDTRVPPSEHRFSAAIKLFIHPAFLFAVLASALLQASHSVYYIFGAIHWRAAGIDDRLIGVLWSVGVVAEILLFLVGARVANKLGPFGLMFLAVAAGVVRWPLLALTDNFTVLFFVQILHGITFGAAHLGAMTFLSRAVPASLSATAQSLHGALALSALSAVISPLSGNLYGQFGGQAFYAMAVLSVFGGLFAVLARRFWRGTELSV